jgi:hypothetical protein
MTFAALFTTLHSRGLIPKRAPAKQSSLRHLAKALGYPTLELCPVGEACLDPAQWTAAMRTYFATLRQQGHTMSAHNCDNILTDLRGLFKLAEAQGLLTTPLPVRLLTSSTRRAFREKRQGTSPYQATYGRKAPYRLPQARWPDDIQAGWQRYTDAAAISDRPPRAVTLRKCAFALETYFGYLVHVHEHGQYAPTWDDLFRVDLLRKFVRWHAERLGRDGSDPRSAHGVVTVGTAAVIANVVELDKALPPEQSRLPPLVAYARKLKRPADLRDKTRYHWAELPVIEAVANSLLAEGRIPVVARYDLRHPGAHRAARFQLGLILKLLVRVPLRQRNVRELQWPRNLWKHPTTGEWILHFEGEELKVARRRDKVNVFEVPLSRLYPKDGPTPDDFIPTLEEFITDFRPLLPNAKTSPYLFLTHRGKPYSSDALGVEIGIAMEMRTGIKLNPHVIRDIVATTLLRKTKDYDMVAALLGNTVAMVMKHYAHLIPEEQMALATGELGKILHTG